MTDFREAYLNGQQAAKDADIARKEIAGVFAEVNAQLGEITGGAIQISRNPQILGNAMSVLMISQALNTQKRPVAMAIAATNPLAATSQSKEIAVWEESSGGYPCLIKFGKVEIGCHDRLALEQALARMLRDPEVADILNKLANLVH